MTHSGEWESCVVSGRQLDNLGELAYKHEKYIARNIQPVFIQ